MISSNLKSLIQQKKVTLGSWITLSDPSISEIFANAGFDWLVVDLEHSAISIDQAINHIRTIELAGSVPLVRLTSNDPQQIKRVMDSGSKGIVVPNVKTANEAEIAVKATRYFPSGNRGVGLARAQQFGFAFEEYFSWQKKGGPIVVVQIEDKIAIENLTNIFNVDGVDAFFIGPYDLSASMGIPGEFDDPLFIKTIDYILEIGKRCNCPAGIHIVEPSKLLLANAIKKGYTFLAYSVDIRMLDVTSREGINSIKDNLNE